MPESFDILITSAFGLESVVSRELSWLGYEAKGISTGRLNFQGDCRAIARSNLWLRSGDRVLIRLTTFPCRDFDTLFETVKAMPWERWIPRDFKFNVNGRSVKSQLSSVPACQRTVKKGIVERLMQAHKTRTLPETGPRIVIEIGLLNDVATLTLDTSGDGLNKRGYRPIVGEAAMKETLAAGLVQLSVWRPDRPLIDPFCGSGTIAIEAAMMARNIAPGLNRSFDAEAWPWFDSAAFGEAREEAKAAPRGELGYTIHASDHSDHALDIARASAKNAGVERDVHFAKRSFDQLQSKAEYGCIITNPPYGIRIGEIEEMDALYASMPAVFRRLPTWSFHILTGRLDLEHIFGRVADRRRKLFNSTIECTYFTFLGPRPPKANSERSQSEPEQLGVDEVGGDGSGDALEDSVSLESSPLDAPGAMPGDAPLPPSSSPSSSGRPPITPSSLPAFAAARERDVREIADFASRLEKNARHLRRYPSRGITCYRVYERDCPDVPLIIDMYEGSVHVAEYEREHSRSPAQQAEWWSMVRDAISKSLGVPLEQIVTKEKRRQRGLSQHEKQDESGDAVLVHEGGLVFEVNLRDYIDTGLFLDHRLTRGMFRELSPGKRVLNLFCYTGAFTVYAAAGGAASTTSVDLSNTYLDWAERNLRHNNLASPKHRFIRSDVLDFLAQQQPGPRFDLVICDPPTFSNSKSTRADWTVEEGHMELFRLLTPLLSPGAVVFFSTNYRRFKLDEAVLGELGLSWREISKQTVPPEYRNERIHRCWKIVKG